MSVRPLVAGTEAGYYDPSHDPRGCAACRQPYPGADGQQRCRRWGVVLPFTDNAPENCREFEEKKDGANHAAAV